MSTRLALLAGVAAGVLVLFPACGGGGSGGGGGGGGTKPKTFLVRTVEPLDGQDSVPNDFSVTVFFNSEVDVDTVTSDTFRVTRLGEPGSPHPGSYGLSEDGLRVTFEPHPWFDTATTYEVRITLDLKSVRGVSLAREFEASFSTSQYASPEPVKQAQFRVVTSRMNSGRSSHTSTLLSNGMVLLTGGYGSMTTVNSSAEVFDPSREDFLPAMGPMRAARASHAATLLRSGLVLITGGERPGDYRAHSTAELFSPATLKFTETAPMSAERAMHTSTLLADGRVLVTGGWTIDDDGYRVWHRSAEIYDPATDTWTRTQNDMEMLRAGHRATTLESGEILITGGSGESTAEIFDPVTARFRSVSARMVAARYLHSSVRLPNGVVLLSDGGSQLGEIFDPDTESFSATGNKANAIRYAAVAFEFRPEEVLIVGGVDFDANFIDGSMEQYDYRYGPGGRYFWISPIPPNGIYIEDPRAFSAWSPLTDGRFLITGGVGDENDQYDLDTAILFDPRID